MYLPKLQPQLGRGQPVPGRTRGSRDCGVRTVQMGIDALTHGRRRPGVMALRKRMRRTGPEPTNVNNAKLAVESYKGLRYSIKRDQASVKQAVAHGRFVQCCVRYDVFTQQGHKTGDPFFSGGHSIGVLGQRHHHGVLEWRVFDPIMDGRRHGIDQGPVWVRASAVLAGMRALAGGPRIYAGVFWR